MHLNIFLNRRLAESDMIKKYKMKKKYIFFALGLILLLFLSKIFYNFRTHLKTESIIAVIDSGIDLNALQPYLFQNRKETPNNQIDDDLNGYVDDVNGWNYFDNNSDVSDFSGHGTKVTQIIVENKNQIKILPIKIVKRNAGIRLNDITQAIEYAMSFNAKIINFSFGVQIDQDGQKKDAEQLENQINHLHEAIIKAKENGICLVSAQAFLIKNPYQLKSKLKTYPQNFEEVLVIGTDKSSDYDSLDHLNFVVKNAKSSSFAAAKVSGILADLISKDPNQTCQELIPFLQEKLADL